MIYIIDIDGTICNVPVDDNGNNLYVDATPIQSRIDRVNSMYDEGHHITYWTSRGIRSGISWGVLTEQQLAMWGCKYNVLYMNKPFYDLFICDRAKSDLEFFNDSV